MKNFLLLAIFAIAGVVTAAALQSVSPNYIGISTCALILVGNGVSDIRGSIAGNVYSRNSSGAYIRNRTKPVNPNTGLQSRVRGMFSYVAQQWRRLTEDQRNVWISFAPHFSRVNRLGQTIPLTGQQLYNKSANNLQTCGRGIVNVIENVDQPNQQLVDSVTVDFSANSALLNAEAATVTAGTDMRVYATAPRSAGSRFAGKSMYKLIKVIAAGDDLNTNDLTASYLDKFGTFGNVGSVIGFKFDSVLTANGLNNAAQSIQAVVVA